MKEIKINPEDLPTLLQVAVAQESCQIEIESLHSLFQKQQALLDYVMEVVREQGEVIDLMYKETKK